MPILANVLLEAKKEDGLTVSAFDLEIGLIGQHRCEVIKEGAVALPGPASLRHRPVAARRHGVAQARRQRPDGDPLRLGALQDRRHPGRGLPGRCPSRRAWPTFEFDADVLAQMIERTAFAISTDETRYNLGGVYLEQAREGPDPHGGHRRPPALSA